MDDMQAGRTLGQRVHTFPYFQPAKLLFPLKQGISKRGELLTCLADLPHGVKNDHSQNQAVDVCRMKPRVEIQRIKCPGELMPVVPYPKGISNQRQQTQYNDNPG